MANGRWRLAVVWFIAQAFWACHWVFPFNVGDAGRDLPVGDARLDRPIDDARPEARLGDTSPDGPPVNLDLLDLSVGAAHTCAIRTSGELYCWGWNEWGQLGVGDRVSVAKPTMVPLSEVTAVSAGVNHTCAVVKQEVYCWGHNGNGHVGIAPTSSAELVPIQVKGLTGVVQIATGNFHTCARTAAGEVWCWGANSHGEVGIPNTSTNTNLTSPQKVAVPCEVPVTQIALGYFHSCASCGGAVYCWGENDAGQLGDGTNTNRGSPVKVLADGPTLDDVVGVWAGARSTCVVRKTGEAACWGWNSHGQVDGRAAGTNGTKATPIYRNSTTRLDNVIELAPGERHTCALINPGRKVACWGSNLLGQLGDWSATDTAAFPQVLGIGNAIRISGTSRTTCALLPKGIKCWGSRGRGQIGDGQDGYVLAPVQVVGLPGKAIALDAGERHTCAVLGDNSVWCWGDNASGQCGSDKKNYSLPEPTPVTSSTTLVATSISTGTAHSCVATATNQALCWGANESGQLGDGTTTSRHEPSFVRSSCTKDSPIGTVAAVAAGERHTCLRSSSKVFCVGGNGSGQLGQDPKLTSSLCPIEVGGLAAADVIAAADGTSCALTGGSSTLRCWGAGYAFPPDSFYLSGKVGSALSLGRSHGCLVVEGAASCWGSSSNGRLGTNSTQDVVAPGKPVVDSNGMALKEVLDVSASPGMSWTGAHSCAAVDGGAYCWGWNAYGQLGDGLRATRANAGKPIFAAGKALSATKVATGPHHSCAIDAAGLVWCWGHNGGGAVGLGAAKLPIAPTPTPVLGL